MRPSTHPSAAAAAAAGFVEIRRSEAEALGRHLGDLIDDPAAFAAALDVGLARLADPAAGEALTWIAPGVRGALGVRGPLLRSVEAGIARTAKGLGPSHLLAVADRASLGEAAEARWIGIRLMDRIVAADPERTWQLMRRAARTASEWITIDTLAAPYARGILLEPYRWAEVEQVAFSPSPWERRLAGSTIARMPYADRSRGRRPEVAARGLDVVGSLVGDDAPEVQKALSWALRSLSIVDAPAVTRFCRSEAESAAATGDGARAWVVRDALVRLAPEDATAIGALVAGVRRRPGAPSTSVAAHMAARFGELPPPASHPMPPLP